MNPPSISKSDSFDRELDRILDEAGAEAGEFTFALKQAIKLAFDKHIISLKKDIWLKNDLPSLLQSDDYIKIREELRAEQRQALFGEEK